MCSGLEFLEAFLDFWRHFWRHVTLFLEAHFWFLEALISGGIHSLAGTERHTCWAGVQVSTMWAGPWDRLSFLCWTPLHVSLNMRQLGGLRCLRHWLVCRHHVRPTRGTRLHGRPTNPRPCDGHHPAHTCKGHLGHEVPDGCVVHLLRRWLEREGTGTHTHTHTSTQVHAGHTHTYTHAHMQDTPSTHAHTRIRTAYCKQQESQRHMRNTGTTTATNFTGTHPQHSSGRASAASAQGGKGENLNGENLNLAKT